MLVFLNSIKESLVYSDKRARIESFVTIEDASHLLFEILPSGNAMNVSASACKGLWFMVGIDNLRCSRSAVPNLSSLATGGGRGVWVAVAHACTLPFVRSAGGCTLHSREWSFAPEWRGLALTRKAPLMQGTCTHVRRSTHLSRGRLCSRAKLHSHECKHPPLAWVKLHAHTLAHLSRSPVLNRLWPSNGPWPRGWGPLL